MSCRDSDEVIPEVRSDSKAPLVSVVVPTYNRPGRLKRAVVSVLAQTYDNVEVIVVDDHSAPPVEEVLADLSDSRVRVLRNCRNRGAPASRNRGIQAARGGYICLLDDDDIFLHQKIEKELQLLKECDVSIVYSLFTVVDYCDNSCEVRGAVGADDIVEELFERNVIRPAAVMVRRRCFDVVGFFDERFPSCQDWEMWMRLFSEFRVAHLPEVVANCEVHSAPSIGDRRGSSIGYYMFYRKYRKWYYRRGAESTLGKAWLFTAVELFDEGYVVRSRRAFLLGYRLMGASLAVLRALRGIVDSAVRQLRHRVSSRLSSWREWE